LTQISLLYPNSHEATGIVMALIMSFEQLPAMQLFAAP